LGLGLGFGLAGHLGLAVGGPALVRQQLLQRAHVRLAEG
jgi:hypothetical protein